ncbi:coiled-coil domain-containing protein 157 [Diachasma alloeum]|uniref:coiled-coil domain-containing protein 157 n=1 Tax=Diachasma alloeum TaxID=454923 RepID=UPI0007384629|nr:coiled-coil domain-containing protein 157 [Diachasma alloeum]
MEKLRMNENILTTKRSSQPALQGSSSKRPRLDPADPSHPNKTDKEMRRLRTHFRSKLSHIETSTTQLQGLRKQIEKLLEKEAKKLEIQAKNELEKLEKLERHLDIENTPKDPQDLQTLQEADISPMKTPMRQKLLDLLPETSKTKKNLNFSGLGHTPTSPDIGSPQEPDEEAQMTPKKLTNESELHLPTLPPQSPYYGIESQQCMVKIQKLNTEKILWEERKTLLVKAARVNELEEELQASRDVISTLREVEREKMTLEQRVEGLKKALEHAETREQDLRISCEDLSRKIEELLKTKAKREQGLEEVEAALRSENAELRAHVESLKRENEELMRKYEGGRDDEVDVTNYVKVEVITEEGFSNQHYVDDVAGDPAVGAEQEETGVAEEPERPEVRGGKRGSGSRKGKKQVGTGRKRGRGKPKDLKESKGRGRRKRGRPPGKGPLRAGNRVERNDITVGTMNCVKVEAITDEGPSHHQNEAGHALGEGATNDGAQNGGCAEEPGNYLEEELSRNSSKQRRIMVGNIPLYPSPSTYFDIDFYSKFVKQDCKTFICMMCTEIYNTRPKIIDHIWSAHYQGRWMCPHCPRSAGDRYGALMHAKKFHRSEK